MPSCSQFMRHANLVLRRLEFLSIILLMSSWSFVPREFLRFPFCSSEMRLYLYRWFWIASAMIAVISLNVVHRHVIGLWLLGIAPAFLFFMSSIVFPVVSHCSMVAVPRSRLSCCAIFGCKLVRCFIQNPCTSSFPGPVQFLIFLAYFLTISSVITTSPIVFPPNSFCAFCIHCVLWLCSFGVWML